MFLIDPRRLERLRREQNPRWEQPALQLPVPEPLPRPSPPQDEDEPSDQERGVVIIEM